jgi:rhodanese-related sulfurtransferase
MNKMVIMRGFRKSYLQLLIETIMRISMKRLIYLLFVITVLGIVALKPAVAVQRQYVNPNGEVEKKDSAIFRTVPPTTAKDMIKSRKEILLVDIRSPKELEEGRIEGSTLMPLWDIINRKQTIPQNKPVMLICAVGGRSLALGKFLSVNGYPEIYNLEGGISAWKKAGLPVVY